MSAPIQLTRTHRILIGVVVAGAVVIAGIGFAGSYAAVRELALQKGFGNFSYVFPIGIDAGICVLLALDLLLTWIRIPFPLLRQTAWLLTAATIAFNGAAAWPDPLGVGMHAVIPILFVVSVEAARHAIGRIADITADKHMEGVRLTRWLLSPLPTFLLWRRMKLWELRSYEQVIKLEQDRLVYQARLRSRFGRAWRRKAPVESLMPLRLARYGVPLAETAPSGLAAAGIEPALLPPAPAAGPEPVDAAPAVLPSRAADRAAAPGAASGSRAARAAGLRRAAESVAPGPGPAGRRVPGRLRPDVRPGAAYASGTRSSSRPSSSRTAATGGSSRSSSGQLRASSSEQSAVRAAARSRSRSRSAAPPRSRLRRTPVPSRSRPGPAAPVRWDRGPAARSRREEDYYLVFQKSIDGSYPTSGQFRGDVEATYGTDAPAARGRPL